MVSSFSEFHFIVCALLANGFIMWIWKEPEDHTPPHQESPRVSGLSFSNTGCSGKGENAWSRILISLTESFVFAFLCDGFEVGRKR